jgi:hypothetical protein
MLATQQTAEFAALMSGPVVYMATGHWPTEMTRSSLVAAKKVEGGDAYSVETGGAPVLLKPFMGIGDEMYRTYQPLKVEG